MIVGLGIDVVEIERMRGVLRRQGDRFLQRVFTPEERAYCAAHRDSAPHLAVRFAAKEALFKALGTGWNKGVTWLDAEVRRSGTGPPSLHLSGECERLRMSLGARFVRISLSHSRGSAVAVVILESDGRE